VGERGHPLLYHCCVARDDVFELDYANVYGIFLSRKFYTYVGAGIGCRAACVDVQGGARDGGAGPRAFTGGSL
jgi:hypothetical protein